MGANGDSICLVCKRPMQPGEPVEAGVHADCSRCRLCGVPWVQHRDEAECEVARQAWRKRQESEKRRTEASEARQAIIRLAKLLEERRPLTFGQAIVVIVIVLLVAPVIGALIRTVVGAVSGR